jgi:hypothetical protein
MQHFKTLRTRTKFAISSVLGLVFALVTFGCNASSDQVSDENIGIKAEAVPEGILLTFCNIPSDTSILSISVLSHYDTAEDIQSWDNKPKSFAMITDTSVVLDYTHASQQLEKVKQTGKVIFPIVQAEQKYIIYADFYSQQERQQIKDGISVLPRSVKAECIIEENGINFNGDFVRLELDNTNSAITLISEPVFSSEVTFDTLKYSYSVTVSDSENGGISFGDHHIPDGLSHDGLTWKFEPQMTNEIKQDYKWFESGSNYPAWAEARVNIIYDDITWSVSFVKTPEFTFSL